MHSIIRSLLQDSLARSLALSLLLVAYLRVHLEREATKDCYDAHPLTTHNLIDSRQSIATNMMMRREKRKRDAE